MTERPPTSSSPSQSGQTPEETLKRGLAALKQKDYTSAIRRLSRLSQRTSTKGSLRVKAQMGLVQALRGNGQTAAAIALCQTLQQHRRVEVQQWSTAMLAKLQQHPPASPPTSSPLATESPTASKPEDSTGFQPLQPTASPQDLSGFQPLQPTDSSPNPEASTSETSSDKTTPPPSHSLTPTHPLPPSTTPPSSTTKT